MSKKRKIRFRGLAASKKRKTRSRGFAAIFTSPWDYPSSSPFYALTAYFCYGVLSVQPVAGAAAPNAATIQLFAWASYGAALLMFNGILATVWAVYEAVFSSE